LYSLVVGKFTFCRIFTVYGRRKEEKCWVQAHFFLHYTAIHAKSYHILTESSDKSCIFSSLPQQALDSSFSILNQNPANTTHRLLLCCWRKNHSQSSFINTFREIFFFSIRTVKKKFRADSTRLILIACRKRRKRRRRMENSSFMLGISLSKFAYCSKKF